jgi:CBS domain containing-hemolysin-like protein
MGGVLIEHLGRFPEPGDVVEVDGLRLEVADVDDGRINKVRVARAATASLPQAE